VAGELVIADSKFLIGVKGLETALARMATFTTGLILSTDERSNLDIFTNPSLIHPAPDVDELVGARTIICPGDLAERASWVVAGMG